MMRCWCGIATQNSNEQLVKNFSSTYLLKDAVNQLYRWLKCQLYFSFYRIYLKSFLFETYKNT